MSGPGADDAKAAGKAAPSEIAVEGKGDAEKGKLAALPTEEAPPLPIGLILLPFFAGPVMAQFTQRWGSNGNDGLPGVMKHPHPKFPRVPVMWGYFFVNLSAVIVIPVLVRNVQDIPAAANASIWYIAIVGFVLCGIPMLNPRSTTKEGTRIVYPCNRVKPLALNTRLYNPSRDVETFADYFPVISLWIVFLQLLHPCFRTLVKLSGDNSMFAEILEKILGLCNLDFELFGEFDIPLINLRIDLAVGLVCLIQVCFSLFVFVYGGARSDEALVVSSAGLHDHALYVKGFKYIQRLIVIADTAFGPIVKSAVTNAACVCPEIPETTWDNTDCYLSTKPWRACMADGHGIVVALVTIVILYIPMGLYVQIFNSCCEGAFEPPHLNTKIALKARIVIKLCVLGNIIAYTKLTDQLELYLAIFLVLMFWCGATFVFLRCPDMAHSDPEGKLVFGEPHVYTATSVLWWTAGSVFFACANFSCGLIALCVAAGADESYIYIIWLCLLGLAAAGCWYWHRAMKEIEVGKGVERQCKIQWTKDLARTWEPEIADFHQPWPPVGASGVSRKEQLTGSFKEEDLERKPSTQTSKQSIAKFAWSRFTQVMTAVFG